MKWTLRKRRESPVSESQHQWLHSVQGKGHITLELKILSVTNQDQSRTLPQRNSRSNQALLYKFLFGAAMAQEHLQVESRQMNFTHRKKTNAHILQLQTQGINKKNQRRQLAVPFPLLDYSCIKPSQLVFEVTNMAPRNGSHFPELTIGL